MELSDIDLTDAEAYVDAVPHEWFAFLRKQRPRLVARGDRRPRLLVRDQVRRLRGRQPGVRHLLLGPQGHLHLGPPRRGHRAAEADDAQHGPAAAHPVPAAREQGLHPPDHRPARGEDPPDGRRHHRRRHREGRGRLRHRHRRRAPAGGHRRPPRRPPGGPAQHVRLVQPDGRPARLRVRRGRRSTSTTPSSPPRRPWSSTPTPPTSTRRSGSTPTRTS